MPKSKYFDIYTVIRRRIEDEQYTDMLPSENELTLEFNCSRNTIRRAIQLLVSDGYVQSIHGKGVMVIYTPYSKEQYTLGKVESFSEAAVRNRTDTKTQVILFSELTVDERIRRRTGFENGVQIYYIQRVRYINGEAVIIDHNYFLKDIVKDLTEDIAKGSIYDYIENTLGINIVTTKRVFTVQKINEKDEKYLNLNGCNCVAVVENYTYNSDGIMFEVTQSRHSPTYFEFHDVATRNNKI